MKSRQINSYSHHLNSTKSLLKNMDTAAIKSHRRDLIEYNKLAQNQALEIINLANAGAVKVGKMWVSVKGIESQCEGKSGDWSWLPFDGGGNGVEEGLQKLEKIEGLLKEVGEIVEVDLRMVRDWQDWW